jgi:hypothetical protein
MKNVKSMESVKFLSILLISALMVFFALQITSQANAQEPEISHIRGLTFQIPLKLSPPVRVGLGATSFLFPEDAETGKEKFEMMLVFLDKDMIESSKKNDAELLQYVKSTFLGTTMKAEKKLKKKALGKEIQGEWQKTTIPRKATLEIYLFPLKDGSKMAAAFRSFEGMAQKESEKVRDAFFSTLVEK